MSNAPTSAAATASPTRERRARGNLAPPRIDDAHFRQCWVAVDPIERLLAAGLITPAEKRAADRFRTTWDAACKSALSAQRWDGVTLDRHCRRPARRR